METIASHFSLPRRKKRNGANAVIPGSEGVTYMEVVPQFYLEYMKKHQVTAYKIVLVKLELGP